MNHIYNQSIKEAFETVEGSTLGLRHEEAGKRLTKNGSNELDAKEQTPAIIVFLRQFHSPLIYILLGALVISAVLGEVADSIVIAIILVFIGIFGFIQEWKAEQSIESLKKLSSPRAKVLRDGKEHLVAAKNLVVGDVVFIDAGDRIPADLRLFEITNFYTQEAALTGESLPVKKTIDPLKGTISLGDRKNIGFSGTVATQGHAKGVVYATGMNTEIGKIADLINKVEEEHTPLQKKLESLGNKIMIWILIVCVIIFTGSLYKGLDMFAAFFLVLTLAVAAVPEGLPAVVTISLGLAVKRMVKKNALVRILPSVETLGSTTVICSDKTGTLTKNEMTVKKIFVNDKTISVTGTGYHAVGDFIFNAKKANPKDYEFLLTIGALCNNASLDDETVLGDPTEGSLLVSAEKAGLYQETLVKKHTRVSEIEFSSERKRMSTVNKFGKKNMLLTKGAPDILLGMCSHYLVNGKKKKLTPAIKKKILATNATFANHALRVLGFAYKDSGKLIEKDLTFVGLQGMIDPPRESAKSAIARCEKAGIKVVMITGDHATTAQAIAHELGIGGKVLTGAQLEKQDLSKIIDEVSIYARVNPEHKIKIVSALKKKGHVVAMTGDGVNDAPALKDADIGIAMGITGTDVSKDASDMILTDDNFTSIVNAVEEGRGVYDNIKKFVNYLLSSNLGEVLVVFFAILIGFRDPQTAAAVVPLLPIHILWMNLVTDGLPAIALGVDPITPKAMDRPPRNPKSDIMSKNMLYNIIAISILMLVSTLILFNHFLSQGALIAQTVAFTTLVSLEVVRVFMIRSQYNLGFFSNPKLILAILASLALQMVIIYLPLYIPFLSDVFKTVPLGLVEWGYIFGMTAIVFVIGQGVGLFIRRVTRTYD